MGYLDFFRHSCCMFLEFAFSCSNLQHEYESNVFLSVLGELLTTAQWIRRFVDEHPDYKKDSVVSETICYDLMNTFDRISRGEVGAPQLFGKPTSKTSDVLLKKCLEIKEEMRKIEAGK